ncbi:MAG: hypothetical protein NTY19_06600 [Planctomycetota bacterium]|nr:hypothetical protein [Planctomycetota bacterium]
MGMLRGQKIEFNFDSLTDCITNLAGSLILVTLILFGLTKPKESGSTRPEYVRRNIGGEASMAPLVHKLETMRTELEHIHREVESLSSQLPQTVSELEKIELRSKSR